MRSTHAHADVHSAQLFKSSRLKLFVLFTFWVLALLEWLYHLGCQALYLRPWTASFTQRTWPANLRLGGRVEAQYMFLFGDFYSKSEPNFSTLLGLFLSPFVTNNLWSHLSLCITPEILKSNFFFPSLGWNVHTHTRACAHFLYFSTRAEQYSEWSTGH